MAETDIDLWPADLAEAPVQSPVAILRKQAEALSRRTSSALMASVSTIEYTRPFYPGSERWKPCFAHRLVLRVPRLEDYELVLLTVYQNLNDYPLLAAISEEDGTFLDSEAALVEWLRTAFASPQTRQVLSTLMGIAA